MYKLRNQNFTKKKKTEQNGKLENMVWMGFKSPDSSWFGMNRGKGSQCKATSKCML